MTIKSEGLFDPIQSRVNLIIKEVAAEEGYAYVIDGSQGTILYADPSTNIIEKVKAKLQKNNSMRYQLLFLVSWLVMPLAGYAQFSYQPVFRN